MVKSGSCTVGTFKANWSISETIKQLLKWSVWHSRIGFLFLIRGVLAFKTGCLKRIIYKYKNGKNVEKINTKLKKH